MEITEALIIISKLEKFLPNRYTRIKSALLVVLKYAGEMQNKENEWLWLRDYIWVSLYF